MSDLWNKPKSLYDIANELAGRLDSPPDDAVDSDATSSQLAANTPNATSPAPVSASSGTNPAHVNSFFDSQYGRISQLANDMNVPPNFMLGLAAGESSWGNPKGKNNLFAFSDANGKPIDYPSYDAAIDAFRNSQWFTRLQNKSNADDFTNELVNTNGGMKKYNSVRPDYAPWVGSMISTVNRRLPIWEQQ